MALCWLVYVNGVDWFMLTALCWSKHLCVDRFTLTGLCWPLYVNWCVLTVFVLIAFREAIKWLEERENFEQVKEWFDSTSRCTDFTLTSVLNRPSSCYLSFLFYLLPHLCSISPFLLLPLFLFYLLPHLCSLSLFLLLLLFHILPVTSLACFTCYLSFLFYLLHACFTCYLSFLFYLLHAYFTCYLSFLFDLLLLLRILPVASLSYFTGYLSCQFYVTSLSSVWEFVLSPFLTGRMFVRRTYFGQFDELWFVS